MLTGAARQSDLQPSDDPSLIDRVSIKVRPVTFAAAELLQSAHAVLRTELRQQDVGPYLHCEVLIRGHNFQVGSCNASRLFDNKIGADVSRHRT